MSSFFRYKCENGHSERAYRREEYRNEGILCEECGEMMERDYKGELKKKNPQEFEPYVDYNLREEPVKITSRKQKRRIKREEGVREVENPFE